MRRLLLAVGAGLLALFLFPLTVWYPSVLAEYPADAVSRLRCLRDVVWAQYLYRPALSKIQFGPDFRVLDPPRRLDRRLRQGMGECASLAENEQGRVVAAWMMRDERDGMTYKVYGRRLGLEEGDFRLNDGPSAGELAHHVSLKCDEAGRFWALWHSAPDASHLVRGGSGVYLRQLDPDGRPVGPERLVSPDRRGEMAEMCVSSRGAPLLVWSESGRVRLRRLDGPIQEVDGAGEFPVVAEAGGRVLVAWGDQGPRAVHSRLYDADLQPLGPTHQAGEGPIPPAFFRLLAVTGTPSGFALAWMRPGGTQGRWIGLDGEPLGAADRILPAGSEVAVLGTPDGVLVGNGRRLTRWRTGGAERPLDLLPLPSRPHEVCLAASRQGVWVAWHEALDYKIAPSLGDNLYIMAGRIATP